MKFKGTSGAIKIKKVIQEFYFSDLRAGGTKRAGDVTSVFFPRKLFFFAFRVAYDQGEGTARGIRDTCTT